MLKGLNDLPVDPQFAADEMERLQGLVDAFAAEMKLKLLKKVNEGRAGWGDPANAEEIYNSLLAHAAGVPLARDQEIDVANFAMFLWCMRVGWVRT